MIIKAITSRGTVLTRLEVASPDGTLIPYYYDAETLHVSNTAELIHESKLPEGTKLIVQREEDEE